MNKLDFYRGSMWWARNPAAPGRQSDTAPDRGRIG